MQYNDSDDLLRISEVSQITSIAPSTLQAWAARREAGERDVPGPTHVALSKRHRRWRRADVEAWLRDQVVR